MAKANSISRVPPESLFSTALAILVLILHSVHTSYTPHSSCILLCNLPFSVHHHYRPHFNASVFTPFPGQNENATLNGPVQRAILGAQHHAPERRTSLRPRGPKGLSREIFPLSRRGGDERVLPRSTDFSFEMRGGSGLPPILPGPAKEVWAARKIC